MKADDVAQYLRDNPDFFEKYADFLAQVYIPHPHGGRAIALSDRQVLTLREKSKALEGKLGELIHYAEENEAIGEKMHRLALALLPTPDMSAMLSQLYFNLREDFVVPHSALRIWRLGDARGATDRAEFEPVSEELKSYAAGLAQPFCGPSSNAEAISWFGDAAQRLRSMALMPLRDRECFGMIALASEDVLRFYPEMGTFHLKRLGELVGAALARYV